MGRASRAFALALLLWSYAQGIGLDCWPYDGVTFKAHVNASVDSWLAVDHRGRLVATEMVEFASSLRFEADGMCDTYKIQNQQGNANTWLAASSDGCKCVGAAAEAAQPVEVLRLDDGGHKFRSGEQYFSLVESSAVCGDCDPNAVRSNADEDNAAIVILDPVLPAETVESGLGFNATGLGHIECPAGTLARLTFGNPQDTTGCVDTCPDGEEPGRSALQEHRCLPTYNDHLLTAGWPEVFIKPRMDGVMTLVVTKPLQPRHFSEDLNPLPYTIDISTNHRTPGPFSRCNAKFTAQDNYIDDVEVSNWDLVGDGDAGLTTPIPPLGAGHRIRGFHRAGSQLQTDLPIPQEAQAARMFVKLYIKSTAAQDSGSMYVNIDAQRRFEARRDFWCPSPMFSPTENCEMECVIDLEGPFPEEKVSVKIGVLYGDEDTLWGFRDFRLEVSQVSATFRYDDWDEECSLSQNPFEDDAAYEERTGYMVVFWGDAQIGQDFVGQEYQFPLTLKYPRATLAVTEDTYAIWARQYNVGVEAEAKSFLSTLSVRACRFCPDMSGAVRRFHLGDFVYAQQNLTSANHTLEVKEVYLSTSENVLDLSSKMATLPIRHQETIPGSVDFSFPVTQLCEQSCFVHVVSWTTPPTPMASNTTTAAPAPPGRRLEATFASPAASLGVDDRSGSTMKAFSAPGRRLKASQSRDKERRLVRHELPARESTGGSGFAVDQAVMEINPQPVTSEAVASEPVTSESQPATNDNFNASAEVEVSSAAAVSSSVMVALVVFAVLKFPLS